MTVSVLHVLGSLEVGGKERAVLRLARRGMQEGQRHALLLFDSPWRGEPVDLPPGEVPYTFVARRGSLDLALARAIAREARTLGAQTLHGHNHTAIFYAALARLFVGRGAPVRAIGTFHNRPAPERAASRLITTAAFRLLDRTIAVSDELAGTLRAERRAPACEVVVNGIDLGTFDPARSGRDADDACRIGSASAGSRDIEAPDNAAPDGIVRVVTLARLVPVKRLDDLIAAFEAALQRVPAMRLDLYGTGPLEPALGSAIRHPDRIALRGVTADPAAVLRGADVFVLCSAHEGTPLAMLEAMACGLPVVATRVGGVPALVGEDDAPDRCGLLVPPERPDLLAQAIATLAGDAALRAEFGRRARARAARHDFEREWDAYRRLYQAAAGPAAATISRAARP